MEWVDVAGPPGSGKSTICDHFWGPHELPMVDEHPPEGWKPFLDELDRLFYLIRKHPTFAAAIRMNNRSIRKMATVFRSGSPQGPYIQTGLAQRGLGFGWRMNTLGIDMDELRPYFELMPVSIGVAITTCNPRVVEERNRARTLVKKTAWEDRSFMVGLMQPAIALALEVLNARGIPVLEVSTEDSIESSREKLREFSTRSPVEPEKARCGSKTPLVQPPNFWLRRDGRNFVPRNDSGEKWPTDKKWVYYRWVENDS